MIVRRLNVLPNLRIASPCRVAWEDMQGSARVRQCSHCDKQVFDLSRLTRAEAEALIEAKAGKLCVRYYEREDGTILLADCTYHETRGGWLPAVVTAAAFAVAVVATPAEPAEPPEDFGLMATSGEISAYPNDDLEGIPIIAVSADGEVTYNGVPVLIDTISERLDSATMKVYGGIEPPVRPPTPWDRAAILQAPGSTDASLINAIVKGIERAGYYPLFAEKK